MRERSSWVGWGGVVCMALALGCGSGDKASADDGDKKKKKDKDEEPEGPPAKLAEGFQGKLDDAVVKKGAAWARKKPIDVPAIPGLRMPGGGTPIKETLGQATFDGQRYDGISIEQAMAGWLVLLADDGWRVARHEAGQNELRIRKGDKMYNAILGAPDGGSTINVVYGVGGAGLKVPVPGKVGDPVYSTSGLDAVKRPGKLEKIYGAYGYVKWNGGGGNWSPLEVMEPSIEPHAKPTDAPCDVAVGAPVKGSFGENRAKKWPGKVVSVYGQLVELDYDDRALKNNWSECSEIVK